MPIEIPNDAPALIVKREAYERLSLRRAAIDLRLGLTADEFRVDGGLVVIGPIHDDAALSRLIDDLEALGLRHFDDYFDLSGNWPTWLRVIVSATTAPL